MYTVSSFRDNLREAFNKAEAGETIHIERYGKTYILKESSITKEEAYKNINWALEAERLNKRVLEQDALKHTLTGNKSKYDTSDRITMDDPTYTDPEDVA